MIGAGSMRRVLLLLLTVFLASGTIAGSIAHAIEERAEMSQPAMMLDSGCLSASVADVAEPEKQSSPDDQKQTPTAPHGCHGHHSGVPAETLVAARSEERSVGKECVNTCRTRVSPKQ